jgi:ribose/xylose/arabinose/galactoside ABC-type transport system permease subunit
MTAYPEERGFRVEPEFRQASGSPEGLPIEPIEVQYQPQQTLPQQNQPQQLALPASPRAVTAAELDGAFDDPEHGEPGRDRFGVHALWELVLILAGVGAAFLVVHTHGGSLTGSHLRAVMVAATVIGLLGLAAGISMRTGAVNLAIGPILVLSALLFGQHEHSGFYGAAGFALGAAVISGIVIAVVVTAFHVPGWAASLGAYFGILIWCTHLPATVTLANRYDTVKDGYYWFGGLAVLAILGGLLGALRPIRRGLGRRRPVSDPADRRGTSAVIVTALAIVGSSLLAGVAGIAITMEQGSMSSGDGLTFTGVGVAIALLGGTSAYGRRGGILGTLAATVLVELAIYDVTLRSWTGGEITVIAVALGVGVLVTRLIEAYGRPRHTPVLDDPTMTWLGRQQGSWADQPALRAGVDEATRIDIEDERWGVR